MIVICNISDYGHGTSCSNKEVNKVSPNCFRHRHKFHSTYSNLPLNIGGELTVLLLFDGRIFFCFELLSIRRFRVEAVIVDVSASVAVSAGVSVVSGRQGQRGVVRFVATSDTSCLIDATVDGLLPAHRHTVLIHEFGDLSSDCDR